jgi:hypothetical protein
MLPLENGQHNEIGVVTGEATAQVVALEPARALPHGIRLAAHAGAGHRRDRHGVGGRVNLSTAADEVGQVGGL